MATDLRRAKILIEYNLNDLEENDEGEKDPIEVEFTEQIADPNNDEYAIDFRWSDVQKEDEEDIALANFIESFQKQTDEVFIKSN